MATTSIDKLFSFLEEQNPILFKGQPPRPGLVPKTGDYEHPFRWIKPAESLANKDNIGYSMKDAVDRINSISFRSAERQKQFPLITPSNFIKQIAEASSFWQRDGWIKIREAAHNILFKNISIKDKTHLYAITLLEALNLAEPISQNLYRGVGVGAIDVSAEQRKFDRNTLKENYEWDAPLISFSSSQNVAHELGRVIPADFYIIYRLKNAKAIKSETVGSSRFFWQHEWISGGRFRTIKSERVGSNLIVDIEQVGTFEIPSESSAKDMLSKSEIRFFTVESNLRQKNLNFQRPKTNGNLNNILVFNIQKDGGGNGIGAGTVVTSTDPGIFTPTYGGSGRKKKKIGLFKEWLQNAQVAYHTHDGFQEHPVAVKDHQKYFAEAKPSSDLPYGENLDPSILRRFYAAYKLRQAGNLDASQKEFVESMIGGVSDDELKEFFRQQYGRQKKETTQKVSSMKIPDTVEGIDAELRALGRARVRPWGSKDVAAQNNISDRMRQLSEERKKLEGKNNIQKFQDFINTTKSDLLSPWFGKTYAEILDASYQLHKNEVVISKEELLKLIDLNEIELEKMLDENG